MCIVNLIFLTNISWCKQKALGTRSVTQSFSNCYKFAAKFQPRPQAPTQNISHETAQQIKVPGDEVDEILCRPKCHICSFFVFFVFHGQMCLSRQYYIIYIYIYIYRYIYIDIYI